MERTGHHSIDGVRSYKRTNAEQQENLSDILALSKRPKQGLLQPCSTTSALVPAPVSVTPQQVASFSSAHTQQQLMIHPDNLQHMFTLSSCSNVNIHRRKFSPKPIVLYCGKTWPDLFSRTCDWEKLNSTCTKWHLVHGHCLRTCDARIVRDLSMSTTQVYHGRLTAAPRLVEVV